MASAHRHLDLEARALLTRLDLVKPFALHETMVPAANVPLPAQVAVERFLMDGRKAVRAMIRGFRVWLRQPGGQRASAAQAQRRFSLVRLRFNAALTQFDIFADAFSQRSEHDTGTWLSGLDVAAADALALPGYYDAPPLVCYLDRGLGAAIRRARTRLPGGARNPVAIVRIPRERMVGSGIASSLIHEVGHQASALLGLIESLRPVLRGLQSSGPGGSMWQLWERWISEILSDFWSVARLGIAATTGLMGVVSLPPAFVFRINLDDPHPFPWIRVRLSCAMGDALYPHPQWGRLSALWASFYPPETLDNARRELLGRLEASMPGFVALLLNHRPKALRGASLREVMDTDRRQPARLAALRETWRRAPNLMARTPPTLAFAVIGQARADGVMTPEEESRLVAGLLRHWALRSNLNASAACAEVSAPRPFAPAT